MDFGFEKSISSAQFIFKLCFCLTLFSNLVLYIVQPLNIVFLNSIASRCFMLTNLVAFFIVIMLNLRNYEVYRTYQTIFIILIVCFSVLSYLMSNSISLYNYIIKIWCYLALPFYLLYLDYLEPDKKLVAFIYIINFINSLVFVILSFSRFKYTGYEAFVRIDRACVTLGYNNPNQTAMYLVITLIVLYCTLYYYHSFLVKAVLLADILYMFWLLIQTESRICIFMAALITVIILLKRKMNLSKLIITGILLLPALFLIVYAIYYNGLTSLIGTGVSLDIDNRGFIYLDTLASIKNSIIFGDFSKFPLANTHNGILSILAALGVVGLLIFYVFMFRSFFHILSKGMKSKVAFISYLGLLMVFFHSCLESAFLTGGSMYAGSLSILIYLAGLDWQKG